MSFSGGSANRQSPRPITGWNVFLWMSIFFGFMFLINGIFIWKAVTTFPGEQRKQAYLIGLDYNDRIDAREAQKRNGWRAAIGLSEDMRTRQIAVACYGADGEALPVDTVELTLRRHVSGEDVRMLTSQTVSHGTAVFSAGDLAPGRWKAEAKIRLSAPFTGAVYYAEKSLVVP